MARLISILLMLNSYSIKAIEFEFNKIDTFSGITYKIFCDLFKVSYVFLHIKFKL